MILQNLAKDCQTLAKSKIFEQTLKPCESMKSIFSSVIMKLIWLFFINFNFFQLINAETEIRFLIKNLVLQLTEHELFMFIYCLETFWTWCFIKVEFTSKLNQNSKQINYILNPLL